MKRILTTISGFFALLLCQLSFASGGLLFNVTATGNPGNVNLTLCLNGRGPLSCQNYTVNALSLSITTAIPGHVYPGTGIKINTPGYTLANLGLDCTLFNNGYCLFSSNNTTPKNISIQSASMYTVGGSITGLTTSGLVLQNNSSDNLTVSSNASSFQFATSLAAGSNYNITVATQPSGLISTYTIGGSISGLSASGLVLQNNGADNLSVGSGATSFQFATPVVSGGSYNTTVFTQPSGLTCSISNGSGTNVLANVSNVNVTCAGVTLLTFTTVSGVPSATGTTLNTLWTQPTPTYQTATGGSSAPGCASPTVSSTTNLNFVFTSAGQTNTAWSPGNSGGGAGASFVGRCVRLCTDFSATTCTNWLFDSGT
jgi:hypothetical protein